MITAAQLGRGFVSMASAVMGPKRTSLSSQSRHGANPILRTGSGNAVARKQPAENEKFTNGQARGRIDGAIASATAVGRILSN